MLDVSAGGAAFLVATKDAPSVGRRIELIEMQTRHRIVREEANPLPMYARVLRHDSLGDETLRVAVRFEADIESPLKVSEQRVDAVVCPHTPLIQPVPPAAAAGSNAGEDMAWSGPRRRHARISSRRQPAKPTDD